METFCWRHNIVEAPYFGRTIFKTHNVLERHKMLEAPYFGHSILETMLWRRKILGGARYSRDTIFQRHNVLERHKMLEAPHVGDNILETQYCGGAIFWRHHILETQYAEGTVFESCLLYTSPSPRDLSTSRMPSSA